MTRPKIRLVVGIEAVVVDAENYDLKVLNRTLDPLDFREFMHVTPESTFNTPVDLPLELGCTETGNAELLRLHKDHTLISFKVPPSPSGLPGKVDTYIVWDNNMVRLTGTSSSACNCFWPWQG